MGQRVMWWSLNSAYFNSQTAVYSVLCRTMDLHPKVWSPGMMSTASLMYYCNDFVPYWNEVEIGEGVALLVRSYKCGSCSTISSQEYIRKDSPSICASIKRPQHGTREANYQERRAGRYLITGTQTQHRRETCQNR